MRISQSDEKPAQDSLLIIPFAIAIGASRKLHYLLRRRLSKSVFRSSKIHIISIPSVSKAVIFLMDGLNKSSLLRFKQVNLTSSWHQC